MKMLGKLFSVSLLAVSLAGCSNDNSSENSDYIYPAPVNYIDVDSGAQSAELLTLKSLQDNNVVLFGFDKFQIEPEHQMLLDEHADYLVKHPNYKVTIEGHADERGTSEYNIALGERRALAVDVYLRSRGVLSQQINVVSFGKEKPAVLGHSKEAYAKNRRALLVY